MKRPSAILALDVALSTPALADKPGSDWRTIGQVAAKLKPAGDGSIEGIGVDDGYREAVADRAGRICKLKLDLKTAAVRKSKPKTDADDDD